MPGQVEGQPDKETSVAAAATAATAATATTAEAPSQHHIELVDSENPSERVAPERDGDSHPSPGLRDSKGWDGKLRVDRNALLQNPEAISDPEYSDDEHVVRGEEISADEGTHARTMLYAYIDV